VGRPSESLERGGGGERCTYKEALPLDPGCPEGQANVIRGASARSSAQLKPQVRLKALNARVTGPTQARRTLEESQAHERMNPFLHGSGGRYRRKTTTVRPKWRGIGGMDVTHKRPYDGTYNTLQGSQLHERQASAR
jgi:hypothetical protein